MMPLPLNCPSCGAGLHPADIDFPGLLATCRHCRTLMSLWHPRPVRHGVQPVGPRPPVALPVQFRIGHGPQGLEIAWRWFTPFAFIPLAFCLTLGGLAGPWTSRAPGLTPPWPMILVPWVHVAAGLWLIYFTAGQFLNSTRIRITGDSLEIRHRPLPWRGSRTLRLDTLRQFFVRHRTRRSRGGSTTDLYDLAAVTSGFGKIDLIRDLRDVDQALFLEQEIERHAGIRDGFVSGELKRE